MPRKAHDRTIIVRLTPEAVVVDYRLDLDGLTLVDDLRADVLSKEELAVLRKKEEFYAAFTKAYAPILAKNLSATLGKEELDFTCVKHACKEEEDHLRCDFVFRAPWKLGPDERYRFAFREGNYDFNTDPGRIDVSLVVHDALRVVDRSQADEAVKKRPATQRRPGDDERLRTASATFDSPETAPPPHELEAIPAPQKLLGPTTPAAPVDLTGETPKPPREHPAMTAKTDAGSAASSLKLRDLLFNTEFGIGTLLALAAGFGAIHALTPGHGKTLVAAYLVGERGTVWHAVLLGLVTTLTHTGAVLILAAVVFVYWRDAVPADIQTALGFTGGLLIAGLGAWLLLRRLSGGVDHVHIGGGHHHHHHGDHHHGHGHADHYHDEHGHAHPMPPEAVGAWGLILVGIQGGIVPCWDAIAMFGLAVAAQRVALGLPLLLAFSAGLAGVLVAVGILVVKVKGFAGSHFGESRLFKLLPVVSAVLITVLGIWLCYDSLHPEPAEVPARVASVP